MYSQCVYNLIYVDHYQLTIVPVNIDNCNDYYLRNYLLKGYGTMR